MEVHIWQVVRDERGAITTWRLVDANPMALNVWGRNLEDIIGKTTEEIFPGADAVRTFLPLVEEIMSTGLPKHWETAFAGTGQVLHMVSSPVEDCFVSMGFDVTADHRRQRELEHALQRVTQATQAGGVGLWDWDLRTNEVHYSDEWKRQLGHASAEIADTFEEWRSRVHPDDLEPTMVQIKAAIEGTRKANDVVFRMRHKDGRTSTSRSAGAWRSACARRRNSSRSARWRPASRTISTTCSPPSPSTYPCCATLRPTCRRRPCC
ncbi:MAG: PAS domain-containing protein [Opitutaceae bacterium]|nr:PAS domain-containing protein [Opitutaceae bacterium]